MMKLYPDKVAQVMSWAELTFGLGYSLGPAVGGVFYDFGGFKLPFIAVGIVGFVIAIFLIFLLPGLNSLVNQYPNLTYLHYHRCG